MSARRILIFKLDSSFADAEKECNDANGDRPFA
jgi:hypothetical protein